MIFYRIMAAAGVISFGLMGGACSHTATKHYAPQHTTAHHSTAPSSKKTWHKTAPYHGKTVTHPPGTGHGKGYHAPHVPKTWKHYPSGHKTYHKPAPPPRQPGKTSDGRFVLPGGMESVCAGGTPPPCQ